MRTLFISLALLLTCSFTATAAEQDVSSQHAAPAVSSPQEKLSLPEINRKNCSDLKLLQQLNDELLRPEAVKIYTRAELQEIVEFSDKCLAILNN